ncbi:MAG: discoidin domain-containing protein [Bacteroidales bacterium]|nr:discoidin domain-containing protein [Bacteroidales bacterium]
MKKLEFKRWIGMIGTILLCVHLQSQNAVKLGGGSYAEYPPLHEAEKPYYTGTDRWGDLSQKLPNMEIFVVDTNTRAVPSTDWWTTLVSTRYSDNLWAYPLMVNAEDYGFYLEFPKYWTADGRFLYSRTRLMISAENFSAESARARRWGAWTIDWVMKDKTNPDKMMAVTLGHGIPFVWAEYNGISPVITIDTLNTATAYFFGDNGSAITFPYTGDHIGVEIKGDHYGIFTPANTQFTLSGNILKIKFPSSNGFVVVGVMPSRSVLSQFNTYAPVIPRDSKINWKYNENTAKIDIYWELVNENLRGQSLLDQIQGWIPHHYKKTTRSFTFNSWEYQTPRGKMKCSVGRKFTITYAFNGLLPAYPVPEDTAVAKNPFRKDWINEMINNYTTKNGYGTETYWGGKDILNYARYMQLAHQMGNMSAFEAFKKKLKEALEDWYTYTPGENYHYFAWYPGWGSFMGFNTRDNENPGIDILQDHAFCYAYHVYAAAILFMYDEEFKNKYKDFTRMLVLDYANWDRNYTRLPWFRSMDPWCGHSFSGGLGDFNGNGQESSSEAMQAWGAMFLLGTVLNDTAMRNAAIFGYVQEAQAVAEYWFDRSHIPANGGVGNYDYTKYKFPYNSNLVTQGIGWWTYFSGDWFWMHAIQWLPMSPLLKYLYEDLNFARWDYTSMWNTKTLGGWESNLGNEAGVGNIALSYLQIFDPDSAASVFDWLWLNNKTTARAPDNNAFSYWYTHSHRSLGDIQWNQWTNIPSSTVYFNSRTNTTTVVVYNPEYTDKLCRVYREGVEYASFVVPPRKLIAHKLNSTLAKIEISAPAKTVVRGGKIQLAARCYDQYGAVVNPAISWGTSGGGTIDANGTFTAGNTNGIFTITARNGNLVATYNIRVGDAPVLSTLEVSPILSRFEIGQAYQLRAKGKDQYGDSISIVPIWSVTGGGGITASGLFTPTVPGGPFTLKVSAGNVSRSYTFYTSYPLCNIALGKPVTASSQVEPTNLAAKVNDGDETTRWESFATDNEWITIDLQNTFDIEKIVIKWEAAFTKIYDVQVSSNNSTFTTIYSQTNGYGGTEVIPVVATGRYVRLLAKKRGTGWANSIYEFEVFGTPQRTGTSVLTTILIEPTFAIVKDTSKQQFTVKGYDQFGNLMSVNPQWSVIGRGSISSSGVYTPTTGSMYLEPSFTVVAQANGLVAKATVVVEEAKRLMQIDILPLTTQQNPLVIPLGHEYVFDFVGKDQFGVDYKGDVTWTATGGGTFTAAGIFKASQTGNFLIFAGKGNVRDTAYVSIRPLSEVNLAWRKPVQTSSSIGDGSKGDKAVDGLPDTRWESVQGVDPQWISIDLQAQYNLSKVVLVWEAASAKAYRIETSNDYQNWTTVYSTSNGMGGREEININATARYIRLYGIQRNTGYGYSLWEFEVYGQSIIPSLTRIRVTPQQAVVALNQPITFTAKGYNQLGEEMAINPTWTCSRGSITTSGNYTSQVYGNYKVTARAGNVMGEAKVRINRPPYLSILYPENNTLFAPGTVVTLCAYAHDDDGTISRVEFREGSTILGTATVSPYTVRLPNLTTGLHLISVVAYDNDGTSTTTTCTLTLGTNGNIIPTVNAGEDRTITLPVNSLTITATASDVDGNITGYQWTQVSGPSNATLAGQNSPTLSLSNLSAGTYLFRITVTDNAGASASDEVQVTVVANTGNIALNKPVTASSTQTGLSTAWVNDGRTDTRWGSDWSDPQWITIDLQGNFNIAQVILRWETASAKNYTIDVSADGNSWTNVKTVTNSTGGAETHNFTAVSGRYIRVYGTARNTGWGYSLWEFEVYGTPVNSLPTGNIALNKPVTVSSTQSGLSANLINDGKTDTRWGSEWSDPQWVIIDLQANYNISQVILRWETASAKNYTIDVSSNGISWTTVKTITNSTGGNETHNFSGINGRYLRLYCTTRNTGWGYSLWEFEVYGTMLSSVAEVITSTSSPGIQESLFPNPAKEKIFLNYTPSKWTDAIIVDASGKIVGKCTLSFNDTKAEINIAGLRSGRYILVLRNKENILTLPFLKQ